MPESTTLPQIDSYRMGGNIGPVIAPDLGKCNVICRGQSDSKGGLQRTFRVRTRWSQFAHQLRFASDNIEIRSNYAMRLTLAT